MTTLTPPSTPPRTPPPEPEEPPIRVLCLTWNVGNAAPREEEVAQWLPQYGAGLDVIVVGTQENGGWEGDSKPGASPPPLERSDSRDSAESAEAETVEHRRMSLAATSGINLTEKKSPRHNASQSEWDAMLLRRMGQAWKVLHHAELMVMKLTVFCRKSSVDVIKNVQSARSATGAAGGQLGNKGGLVISLTYGHTSLCFVSSHLAAHMNKLLDRNDDFWEVLRETRGKIGPASRADVAHSFDHVFWMGDLNYRIDLSRNTLKGKKDEAADVTAITQLINAKDYNALIAIDQLRLCQEEGTAFVGFYEGRMNFAPTFKVKRQVGMAYQEKRVPSYCDRILWKPMPPLLGRVQQTKLDSVPGVSTSDHKPVVAQFAIKPTPIIRLEPRANRANFPLVRLSDMDVRLRGGAIDFMSEKCDPYAVFYTNPHGLLGDEAQMTAIVLGNKDHASDNSPAPANRHSQPSASSQLDRSLSTMRFQTPSEQYLYKFGWNDRQLPLLRPHVASHTDLEHVTLIVAMYDHDVLTADDSLGTVLIPLKRPPDATGDADEFEFTVDTPISWERGVGNFKCKVTVSSGNALAAALQRASADKAGTASKIWRGKGGTCGGMCEVQ